MKITTEMVEAAAMLLFVRDQFTLPQLDGPWARQPAEVKKHIPALCAVQLGNRKKQETGKWQRDMT